MQPVGPFTAENFRREVERHEVVVLARDRDVADADLGLHGAGLVDHDEPAGRRRRLDAPVRLNIHLPPRGERPLGARERLVGGHVADNGEDRVVRAEPSFVEREQIVPRQRRDRLWRAALRPAVRVESIHEAIENDVGEKLRIVVADAHARERLLALALELLRRERGMLREIRHEIEAEAQAVFHDDRVDRRHAGTRARPERPANRIDGAGDLLCGSRGGPLIQ